MIQPTDDPTDLGVSAEAVKGESSTYLNLPVSEPPVA